MESHLNEWNPPSRSSRDMSSKHGAEIAATMLGCHDIGVDMLMVYDARFDGSTYSAFFLPSVRGGCLSHGYYAFAAFSILYRLGTQVKLECDTEGVYAVAATDGKKNAVMISNISGKDQPLEIEGVDLNDARWSLIDDRRLLSWSLALKEIKNDTVVLVEF